MAHANRATMKSIKKELNDLRITVDDHEERLRDMEEREIVNMLQEPNLPGSSKYRYTYQEIANYVGVSSTTVYNIAVKYNLTRRNLG